MNFTTDATEFAVSMKGLCSPVDRGFARGPQRIGLDTFSHSLSKRAIDCAAGLVCEGFKLTDNFVLSLS